MDKLVKLDNREIVSYQNAKQKYLETTSLAQAVALGKKIGIKISELTPYAIDVLWGEIALGRFLKTMEKNKGGNPYLQPVDTNDKLSVPTVEEIVGSRDKSSLLQKVAKFSDEVIQEYIDLCVENEMLPKSGDLKNKNTTISKMTGDNEGYTPSEYIEKSRSVLGEIGLDPASSDFANETVKAEEYYTIDDDGLEKKWEGSVFLNPPYSQPDIAMFIEKLVNSVNKGDVKSAILLTNNNTDTSWFVTAATHCRLMCFTKGRVKFYKRDGTISAPTNGQCFFYFGDNPRLFYDEFSDVGLIVSLYDPTS